MIKVVRKKRQLLKRKKHYNTVTGKQQQWKPKDNRIISQSAEAKHIHISVESEKVSQE